MKNPHNCKFFDLRIHTDEREIGESPILCDNATASIALAFLFQLLGLKLIFFDNRASCLDVAVLLPIT